MNKQPVSYLQIDKRWKDKRYPCKGGTMSVGGGGCGPTSAAMLIETINGKQCMPTDAMDWACKHGYVYAGQGTSYDCFRPLFAAHGIECDLLTWCKCLDAGSWVREKVVDMLNRGYYFIALMKKGLWTSGGHYIVVWWADDRIHINDPASTKWERLNGDPGTFFSQAKYFWWVDARAFNHTVKANKEGEDMKRYQTMDEIKKDAPWAAETVEKLIKRDVIRGTGNGLDFSEDMLRVLVYNDRAGVYD